MDISHSFSDILRDEAIADVIKELDDFDAVVSKNEERGILTYTRTKNDFHSERDANSIGSTFFADSEPSKCVGKGKCKNQRTKQWFKFDKHFDSLIEDSLNHVVDYTLNTVINIDDEEMCFSRKRKSCIMGLIKEITSSYKKLWKDVYLPHNCGCDTSTGDASFEKELAKMFDDISIRMDVTSHYGEFDHDKPSKLDEIESLPLVECENMECDEHIDNFTLKRQFIELIDQQGIPQFYLLLECIFAVLRKSKKCFKLCYALDLITTMIEVMPMLSVLLVMSQESRRGYVMFDVQYYNKRKKRGHFGTLIGIIKLFLEPLTPNYTENSPKQSIESLYASSLNGSFVPFYLTENKNDSDDEYMCSICVVYVLYRSLKLVRLVADCFLELFYLVGFDKSKVLRLRKILKKYVFLPFFRLKKLHELLIPIVGEYNFKPLTKNLDLSKMIKMYLYPPPPLFLLRLEFLDILKKFSIVTKINLIDFYPEIVNFNLKFAKKSKTTLMTIPSETNVERTLKTKKERVNKILKHNLYLFIFSASFTLFADFMKRSLDNIQTFLGGYFVLVPQFELNMSFVDESAIVEENAYRIQLSVLQLLKLTVSNKMLNDGNIMRISSMGLIQDAIMKRLLVLCWHYCTSNRLDERLAQYIRGYDEDERMAHGGIDKRRTGSSCNGNCKFLIPYDAVSLAKFSNRLSCVSTTFERMNIGLRSARRQTVVADEIENLVKSRKGTLDYTSTSMLQNESVDYLICSECPIKFKRATYTSDTDPKPETCDLECLFYRHMLNNPESAKLIQNLRFAVFSQALETICMNIPNREHGQNRSQKMDYESVFGDLSPIWHSMVNFLLKNKEGNRDRDTQ